MDIYVVRNNTIPRRLLWRGQAKNATDALRMADKGDGRGRIAYLVLKQVSP